MTGLWHVTLTSGHVRWSPRSEVADAVMPVMAAHLAAARRRAPALVPGQPGYTARARARDGVLGMTLRAGVAPIVGLVVAPALADAEMMLPAEQRQRVPLLARPAPVCLVWLLPAIVTIDRADQLWLGDYERCAAWAWLERPHARTP